MLSPGALASHAFFKNTGRVLPRRLAWRHLQHAGVAEWQTRRIQNPLLARVWRFKSSSRYYQLGLALPMTRAGNVGLEHPRAVAFSLRTAPTRSGPLSNIPQRFPSIPRYNKRPGMRAAATCGLHWYGRAGRSGQAPLAGPGAAYKFVMHEAANAATGGQRSGSGASILLCLLPKQLEMFQIASGNSTVKDLNNHDLARIYFDRSELGGDAGVGGR